MLLKNFVLFLLLLVPTLNNAAQTDQATLKPFVPGSYQQILTETAQQPFMLVVWSITCSSCLKDMALLNSLHKKYPKLKMVMLATDGAQASTQIQGILQKNELTTVENWNYADENSQKLQYEIDPTWYGELPRTYFFDKAHQREGISGVLIEADYQAHFAKILK
ncbi:TlpA family protein disulfide reductase [Crenothrix sp.]|uniref:TlpA family protein disulfide reductase n=1 Tax=Crenothrix sp. TaxID=3100433 RepID=UPI00374DCFDA